MAAVVLYACRLSFKSFLDRDAHIHARRQCAQQAICTLHAHVRLHFESPITRISAVRLSTSAMFDAVQVKECH